MAVRQSLHPQLHAVFTAHTVLKHIKLQGAYHAYHDVLIAAAGELKDLYGTLLGDLLHALNKLLALHGVLGGHGAEHLRLKGRDAGVSELLTRYRNGIADGENARVEHADNITGIGLVHNLSLSGHHGLGLRQAHFFARLHMVILCLSLKFSGADAHKGQAVPVGLIHVGLDFEHKGGEIRREGIHQALVALARQRRWGHTQKGLQKRLHAEICKCRAEEYRGELAAPHSLQVKFRPGAQKLHIVPEDVRELLADKLRQGGIIQLRLGDGGFLGVTRIGEVKDALFLSVIHPLKLSAAADGPVHGIGGDPQLPLYLLAQLQWVPGLPVHLVHKGENGDVPQSADLEELAGLGLHTLGPVNDHHRTVGSHEGAVGILGKVLVAGGIQDVDAEAVVAELHHR